MFVTGGSHFVLWLSTTDALYVRLYSKQLIDRGSCDLEMITREHKENANELEISSLICLAKEYKCMRLLVSL